MTPRWLNTAPRWPAKYDMSEIIFRMKNATPTTRNLDFLFSGVAPARPIQPGTLPHVRMCCPRSDVNTTNMLSRNAAKVLWNTGGGFENSVL